MFEFELQPVLDHRRHLEEEAQREVAEAQRWMQRILGEIQAVATARAEALQAWREEIEAGHGMARQMLFDAWREDLRRQERILRQRVLQANTVLTEKKRRLVQAHHEVEKFEHLRKEALKEYRERLETQERRFLDDLMIMRRGRDNPLNTRVEISR